MQDTDAVCPVCSAPDPNMSEAGAFQQPQQPQQAFQQPYPQQTYPQQQYAQPGYDPNYAYAGAAPVKSAGPMSDKKKVTICAIIVGSVTVLLWLFVLIFCKDVTDPLKNYKKVLESGNVSAIAKVDFSTGTVDSAKASAAAKEAKDDFKKTYGSDAKMTYEVLGREKLDIANFYSYNKNAKSGNKIKKAYDVTVKFTIKGKKGTDTYVDTLTMVKTGDGWRCFDGLIGSNIYKDGSAGGFDFDDFDYDDNDNDDLDFDDYDYEDFDW